MEQSAHVGGIEGDSGSRISTFAVIDLETTNLPQYNQNRVSITELCIYAFDSAILEDNNVSTKLEPRSELSPQLFPELPRPPRVLHKLNLLFQPSMAVQPETEYITGLNNYLLERESKLNENAGQLIIKFIEHLPAPVCLIAQNGWNFDFPIIRKSLEKLKLEFPASLRCVDSLRAFIEIDASRKDEIDIQTSTQLILNRELEDIPQEIDFEAQNNKTPKRPTLPHSESLKIRRHLYDGSYDEGTEDSPYKRSSQKYRCRRQLFSALKCATTKRIPPRGRYKLGNLYEKTFGVKAIDAHQAEADVKMLTQLVQHYGTYFLAFAEEQSIPFAEVVPLGGKIPNNK